jgi:hypothetical protein
MNKRLWELRRTKKSLTPADSLKYDKIRENRSEPSSSVGTVTVEAAGVPLLAGLIYFLLPP